METLLERGEHDLGALQTGGAGDGVGPQLVHTAAAPCLGVGLCMSAWSDRVHLHLHGAAAGHSVSVCVAMHGSTYRGDEKSDEDADEQRSRRRQLSAQRQRSHGFHRGMLGGDLLANSRGEESSNEGGDGRSGGGRGRERGRERGGGGKSARMCGRRGKSKGTTRCSISTPSSASEQPRNLFSNFYHLDNNRPRFKMHPSTPCWVSQRIHHPCIRPRAATCIHPAAKQRTKISHFPLVKLYMRHTRRASQKDLQKKLQVDLS